MNHKIRLWNSDRIIRKPRLQSLPSYGTATGCPTLPPPVHESENQNNSLQITDQIEPNDFSSTTKYTNLCDCKSSDWWYGFCCGLCCQSNAGRLANLKLRSDRIHSESHSSYLIWGIYVFLSFACIAGLLACIPFFIDDLSRFMNYCRPTPPSEWPSNGYCDTLKGWFISACVLGAIYCLVLIFRAISTYKLRRLFLKTQLDHRNHPNINDEEKCVSSLIASSCSPCMYGQINMAQNFLSQE